MDIRERHFGPIATVGDDGRAQHVDLDALIRRLLLFDYCYLESSLLCELPTMVEVFGYRGVMKLLEDPHFQIIGDVLTAGSIGQTAPLQVTARRGYALPLGSYRIKPATLGPGEWVRHALANARTVPGLSVDQRARLEQTLTDQLIRYPTDAAPAGEQMFGQDLAASETRVLPVLQKVVREQLGVDVSGRLRLEVETLPFEGDYRVESNLQADFGVDALTAHKMVEQALLGIATLNLRIRLMQDLSAVTGFQDSEAPFFEARLAFLFAQLDPDTQEKRFRRVTTLAGLPSVAALGSRARMDMGKLLRLRNRADCADLRRWLRSTDGQSDRDIEQQFRSVKATLATILHTPAGKAVRFVVTSGIGALPVAGVVLGPLSALADQFVSEKLIGSPGPVCFLSHEYSSIFKESRE